MLVHRQSQLVLSLVFGGFLLSFLFHRILLTWVGENLSLSNLIER